MAAGEVGEQGTYRLARRLPAGVCWGRREEVIGAMPSVAVAVTVGAEHNNRHFGALRQAASSVSNWPHFDAGRGSSPESVVTGAARWSTTCASTEAERRHYLLVAVPRSGVKAS